MPRVLIADKLSPAAIAIFKERGVDADVKTGLSKDELLKIVGDYAGVASYGGTAHPIWTDSRANLDPAPGCSRGIKMEEVFTAAVK